MAHQVETMMFVGATPWHRLGVKMDNPPTTEAAMNAAGLNWAVGLKTLSTPDGQIVDHRAAYRKSDGKVLGVVGPLYKPIQNVDAFQWFDPFVQAGEATIETAGSLFGGKKVWILAKLNRSPSVIVPGDEVEKFILLANSHDGTISARVGFTPVRVVCNNTLAMAANSAGSKLLHVRHMKNADDALAAVRDVMNTANASFEATADQYRALAAKPIKSADLEKFVKIVFRKVEDKRDAHELPSSSHAPLEVDTASLLDSIMDETVAVKARKERANSPSAIVAELFESPTNSTPGAKGTLWGALNAVTEYTTHHRGRTDDTRASGLAFGEGAALNARALSVAMQML